MWKRITVCFMVVILASCTKDERDKGLTKEQAQHRADSIYNIKFIQIKKQAAEDLDRRLSIELKPKIDSLLGRTLTASEPPVLNTENPVDRPLPKNDTTETSLPKDSAR